jgi:hypothetical protein
MIGISDIVLCMRVSGMCVIIMEVKVINISGDRNKG